MAEPPNLRYSDGETDCGSCRFFKPQSQTCSLYHDKPVSPDLVCDSYEPLDSDPVKEDNGTAA